MQPRNVSNAHWRMCRVGAALALGLAVHSAWADTAVYCVNSDSDLVSALSIAETTPLTIKLVQKTYHLNQTVWNGNLTPAVTGKFKGGSSLLGGYVDANCSSRNIGVGNTVVTDTTATPFDRVNILGDATIEGITFELPNGLGIVADKDENAALPAGSQLTIRRNVFIQGTSGATLGVGWNEDASVGGTVRIVDNLVHDNTSDVLWAAIYADVVSGKPTIELINNTVVNNGGGYGFFLKNDVTPVPVYAYNNIFYGNVAKDFVVAQGSAITLGSNVIGTHTWTGTAQNDNTTTGDPKLDPSTFKPIESPASNVINSGTSTVIGGLPATDLPGRTRQVGSAPDRGAFESSISDQAIVPVTVTADSGVGSLRSAIASANANNSSTLILFDLGPASGCPYTIAPLTPLPQITGSVVFDGDYQDGSSVNTLPFGFDASICVILDGKPHNLADGLYVSPAASDNVEAHIIGLAFSGFTHSAIGLYGGSGHTVTGSRIGGSNNGVALDPSANGIVVGPAVHDVTIGGGNYFDAYDKRNLIGSATGGGIVVDGATASLVAGHDNQITGNFIGVGYNGNTGAFVDRGNGSAGVTLAGPNNGVYYNVIGYNGSYGINLTNPTATANSIAYNEIGIFSPNSSVLGNGGGVVIQNAAHGNYVIQNEIANNSGTGIRVVNGQGNSITGGAIYNNNGLGIDLAGAGVTNNDNDSDPQVVNYANRGLNFPVLDTATGGHQHGVIYGSLLTTFGTYTINAYASLTCDASGHGEGQYYLGSFPATTGNVGSAGQFTAPISYEFDFPNAISQPINRYITLTAQDESGNTSEFSACLLYVDDTVFADDFD